MNDRTEFMQFGNPIEKPIREKVDGYARSNAVRKWNQSGDLSGWPITVRNTEHVNPLPGRLPHGLIAGHSNENGRT